MSGVRIPRFIVTRAIMYARINKTEESCGFFFTNPGKVHVEDIFSKTPDLVDSWGERHPYVEYRVAPNMAKDPKVGTEIPAEWMAHHIVDLKLEPLAMFHSHPSRINAPSEGDLKFFPEHYVNWGMIWVADQPQSIWLYNQFGEVRHQLESGVVIPDVQ